MSQNGLDWGTGQTQPSSSDRYSISFQNEAATCEISFYTRFEIVEGTWAIFNICASESKLIKTTRTKVDGRPPHIELFLWHFQCCPNGATHSCN